MEEKSFTLEKQLYETHFFGLSSIGILNEIYSVFSTSIERGLVEFENDCKKIAENKECEDVLTPKLIAKIVKIFEQYFSSLENYLLANHFNIPEHILLPDDQGNRKEGITHEHIINKFKELDASGHHLKEVHEFNRNLTSIKSSMKNKINLLKDNPLTACQSVSDRLVDTCLEVKKQRNVIASLLTRVKEISRY